MLEKIKKFHGDKIIIDTIVLLILIVLVFIFFKNSITNLEKIKLEEKSIEISDYFEELKGMDKNNYFNFAIEYLYNSKDKDEFSIKEILDVINSNFNVSYTEKDILDIGTTGDMVNRGIMFDSALNGYKYLNDETITDIANKSVIYFKIKKMSKINENKFKIIYDRYVLDNPYEVLNYYNNYNIENSDNKIDTTDVIEYLKGNRKIGTFKRIVRQETKTNFGKKDGTVEVTYIVKNNKLLVDKIK